MTVGTLPAAERRRRIRGDGLRFRVGPFLVSLQSPFGAVLHAVELLYAEQPLEPDGPGAHFQIRVDAPTIWRRLMRPQAQFYLDGRTPFIPLPAGMSALVFEAGLNWCIGTHANQYIVVHAATLERDGVGLVMPARPGSGKSTLCAALVARGWRLLSDEFALIEPQTGLLRPVPRPIALKDGSIGLIREWWPEAVAGAPMLNNEGQRVAYFRAPPSSVAASATRCEPRIVLIPMYRAGAPLTARPLSRAQTTLHLGDSSFNYNLHGRLGFTRLTEIADRGGAVELEYSALADGVAFVDRLLEERRG